MIILNSRYLYSKIKSARTKFISLILSEEDLNFVLASGAYCQKITDSNVTKYLVDAEELRYLMYR